MAKITWAIISGAYPPQTAGVSDYTRHFAEALAAAGDEVHVWAPVSREIVPTDTGVTVHCLPDKFGIRSLIGLHDALSRLPQPRCCVLQYVPQSFGFRLFLESFHDREVALDLRIRTRFHPAFPAAAFKDVGSIGKFGLQRDEFVSDKLLDRLAEALFVG